jgi:hypothetical protein
MPSMQSETTTKPLRDLVQRFNSGEILLPQFQRDDVWGQLREEFDLNGRSQERTRHFAPTTSGDEGHSP